MRTFYMDKLQRAARASGIDAETAADNIHNAARMMREQGGDN